MNRTPPANDGPAQQEFIAPDNGGWHYTIMRDWIAVCPDVGAVAARVYWIVRSVMHEKGDRTRRLSLDELCWLLPGINDKPTSIDRMKDALRELEGIGLLSNPDGDVQRRWITDPKTGRQTRENSRRWQIHDYPPDAASYNGWKSAIAKLDAYPGPGWRQAAKGTEGGKKPSQSRPAKTRKTPGRTEGGKKPSQSQAAHQGGDTDTPGHTESAFFHSEHGKKLDADPVTRDNPAPNEFFQGSLNQPTTAAGQGDAAAESVKSGTDGWLEEGSGQENEPSTPDDDHSRESEAFALLDALMMPTGPQYVPQRTDIRAVADALASGVEAERITAELISGISGAEVPAKTIKGRCAGLRKLHAASSTHSGSQRQQSAKPDWCGQCDSDDYRWTQLDNGRMAKCPRCHPSRQQPKAVPASPAPNKHVLDQLGVGA